VPLSVTALRHPQGHVLPVLGPQLAFQLASAIRKVSNSLKEAYEPPRGGYEIPLAPYLPLAASDLVDWNEDAHSHALTAVNAAESTLIWQVPDSIRLLLDAGITFGCGVNDHLYFLCMLFVVIGHWVVLFEGSCDAAPTAAVDEAHSTTVCFGH
jgi:hypothetical protein